MPTIQVDLTEVKQKLNTNNVVFTARHEDDIITREIDVSEFDTWETFANWLINQEPQFVLLPEKEKSLTIEFHTEIVDGETVKILDSVTVLD